MDNVTIILGDALTELAKLPTQSVDLILTDPPYLAGDFSWMLPELLRIGKRLVLTPGKLESFNWIHRQGSADGWRNRAIAKACAGLARSQEWR